jgi:CBS domain-containing protein
MKVSEVMTRDVVTATPDTTYKEAVDLMVSHDVGALPVLDDLGRVIGIVSEADLVPKAGYPGDRRRPVLLQVIDGDWGAAQKAQARTVAEVMTVRPVVVHPDQDVSAAARTLVRSQRKRVPVVDEVGLLVGIVSRQDLLGAYARPDEVIYDDLVAALSEPTRVPELHDVHVQIRDGVVTLSGRVDTDDDRRVVTSVVWRVPGVVDVVDEIAVPVAVSGG